MQLCPPPGNVHEAHIGTLVHDTCIDVMGILDQRMDHINGVQICIFGYGASGVVPSSFCVDYNTDTKKVHVSAAKKSSTAKNADKTLDRDAFDVKEAAHCVIAESINACLSMQVYTKSKAGHVLEDTQQDILAQIKRRCWRDVWARPGKGPKLDNKDLYVTESLPYGKSISFIFFPDILGRSFEIAGRRPRLAPSIDAIPE